MALTISSCNLTALNNETEMEYLRRSAWDDEMQQFGTNYRYIVPPMLTVLLLATLINFVILSSTAYLTKKPSVNLRICISLAASDCVASCACLSDLFLTSYIAYVVPQWYDSIPSCLLLTVKLIWISGMFTSCAHLCLLSMNHFIGTKFPLQYRSCMTTRLCHCLLIGIWLFPITYFVGSFFFEQLGKPSCLYELSTIRKLSYSGAVLIFFLLTTSAHGYILMKYYGSSNEANIRVHHSERRKAAKEHKVVKVSLAITGTFALGWLPYCAYDSLICSKRRSCRPVDAELENFLVSCLNQLPCDSACVWESSDFSVNTLMGLSLTRYMLVLLKLLSNALIYTFRVVEIQTALLRMVGRKLPETSSTTSSPTARFSRLSSRLRFSHQSPAKV